MPWASSPLSFHLAAISSAVIPLCASSSSDIASAPAGLTSQLASSPRSISASPAPLRNPPTAAPTDSYHFRFSGAAAQPARTPDAQLCAAASRSDLAAASSLSAAARIASPGSWNGRIVSVMSWPLAAAALTLSFARETSASYADLASWETWSPRACSRSAQRARDCAWSSASA
jgi:hypothetical protein